MRTKTSTTSRIKFDSRYINEVTKAAGRLPRIACEDLACWGIKREFKGKWHADDIKKFEDIYWMVAVAKKAAEVAGVSQQFDAMVRS